MSLFFRLCQPNFFPIANKLSTPAIGGSGIIRLSEAAWEALEEYNLAATYLVAGVGTYLGSTLVEPAPWSPAAGDLYVTKTGSDGNTGLDPAFPKLTIWSALNSISATGGKTIWVDSGTYAENVSSTGYMLIAKTFANFVTVRGKPGTLPIITNVSGSYVLRPNVVDKLRFRNVELQAPTGTAGSGFVFSNASLSNFELVECVLRDLFTRTTAISLANSTQSNIAIKRCEFISSGAFSTSVTTATGTILVGNRFNQTVSNSVTVSGTATLNSNTGSKTGFTLNGRTSVAATAVAAKANTIQNVVHTGGAVGFSSVLTLERNTIISPTGVRGLAIFGYTSGGGAWNNTISSLGDTGLSWPGDGGTNVCTGHVIEGNNITNQGSNGHALLISVGGTATVSNNTTNASGGGNYGLVLKGSSNTVTGNTFIGGGANGILIKDCSGSTITGNTINSSAGVALEFNGASLNPTNNTVTGNTFNVTGGTLYTQTLAEIGTGNVVNNNNYSLSGSGAWGSLLGATVNSLTEVRSRWSSQYDVTTNDNASVAV